MCEENRGGYLPVMGVLRHITDQSPNGLGYTGWISFEVFNKGLFEEGDQVPKNHAARARISWEKVCAFMGWENIIREGEQSDNKGN